MASISAQYISEKYYFGKYGEFPDPFFCTLDEQESEGVLTDKKIDIDSSVQQSLDSYLDYGALIEEEADLIERVKVFKDVEEMALKIDIAKPESDKSVEIHRVITYFQTQEEAEKFHYVVDDFKDGKITSLISEDGNSSIVNTSKGNLTLEEFDGMISEIREQIVVEHDRTEASIARLLEELRDKAFWCTLCDGYGELQNSYHHAPQCCEVCGGLGRK